MDDPNKRDTEDKILSAARDIAQVLRLLAERKPVGRAPQPEPSGGGKVMNISRERAS